MGAGPSMLVPTGWDERFTAATDTALVERLRQTTADILVTSTPALAALAVEFVSTTVRVVHQEHFMDPGGLEVPHALASHGPRLDAVVGLTDRHVRWLQQGIGPSMPPMHVVPHALSADFSPRTSLQNRTIVGVGKLVPQKRFGQLIKAFQTANDLVPGWRLRIYGDGPLKSELRQAVWRAGLAGMVDIVPSTSRIAAELSKASILALTSNDEALPLVALEAAAAGVPTVAFDSASGPAEVIDESGGGLLVPDDEPVGLAAALAHLMVDAEALADYSERARAGSLSYASAGIARLWDEIYKDILNRGPRRQVNGLPGKVMETDGKNDSGTAAKQATEGGEWLGMQLVGARPQSREPAVLAEQLRALLDARNISYVDVGTVSLTPTLGMDEADRAEVALCVEELIETLGLSCIAQKGDAPIHVRSWKTHDDRPAAVAFATVFRITEQREDTSDFESYIDLELWRSDDDGTRFAPRQNDLADWVDSATWNTWIASRTRTPSGVRAWNHIEFPIDAVFMWVDGADPDWDSKRRARLANSPTTWRLDEDHDAVSSARFVSRDEIYYSVTAIKSFMPWVRTIYIVTDGQVHQRIAQEYPDVRFVDHSDIFPDPSVLPVFNSQAIESCLHRIQGLAEHFICFNDDVMVVRPLAPTTFFDANGAARFFPSNVKINHGANSDAPHLQAGSNNRDVVLKECGFEITNAMLHTPLPHLRSVVAELEAQHPDKFVSTRGSAFRSPGDISALSSLAQYYGWATGRYVPSSMNYRYLRLSGPLLRYRMMNILRDNQLDVVALGEPLPTDRIHQDERGIVKEFLESLVGVRYRPQ